MLQKQVQQADPAPPKLRQGVEYLLGDEVKARGRGRKVIRVCCHMLLFQIGSDPSRRAF